MKLVFIYGMPGVGKLTVAKELSEITGYKLFHNHLTVDLVHSIFKFGTRPFADLREKIWLDVFDYACRYRLSGMIFTYVFERMVSNDYIKKIEKIIHGRGTIHFVELHCHIDELKKRVEEKSRKKYGKIVSAIQLEELLASNSVYTPYFNHKVLKIDNTHIAALEVAKKILYHFNLE